MEKPTAEQAAWVMEKIYESLDGGYSFRGMIYNALGYDDPESYSLFFNAGGMSLTNMHTWYEEFRELSLALEIATKAHKGQVDKAGHPYIAHPVIVASMVDETYEKVVALLHDVVEDSDMTIEDLRKVGFSENTLDAVLAITKVESEGYDNYLARVAANPIARAVKIADMTHNSVLSRIPNPGSKDFERVERYKASVEKLREMSKNSNRENL